MIGKAFLKLGEPEFIDLLSKEVRLPVPDAFRLPLSLLKAKTEKDETTGQEMVALNELLRVASKDPDEAKANARMADFHQRVGDGVQASLNKQFENYELTGMT